MSRSGERLRLFVRRGCSLCEDMHAELLGLRDELGFELEVVDIDADPDLQSRYDTLVPVVRLGERDICSYFLDPVALRGALTAQ